VVLSGETYHSVGLYLLQAYSRSVYVCVCVFLAEHVVCGVQPEGNN
jgi:hypothetical protein